MEKTALLGHDLTINFSITTIRFYVIRNRKSKTKSSRVETSRSPLEAILVKLGYLNMYTNILNKNAGHPIFHETLCRNLSNLHPEN